MVNRSAEREQFLADVLVCFVEDFGTNSWRCIKADTYQPSEPSLGPPFDIAPSESKVTFIDMEDENEPEYEVDIEVIARGIQRIITGEVGCNSAIQKTVLLASHENDAGEIDSYDADMIVQAGVFGELVYG